MILKTELIFVIEYSKMSTIFMLQIWLGACVVGVSVFIVCELAFKSLSCTLLFINHPGSFDPIAIHIHIF
jgi:hypothetical protein